MLLFGFFSGFRKYLYALLLTYTVLLVSCTKSAYLPRQGRAGAIESSREYAKSRVSDLKWFNLIAIDSSGFLIVKFKLKSSTRNGGGPVFLIDTLTGNLVRERYYQ